MAHVVAAVARSGEVRVAHTGRTRPPAHVVAPVASVAPAATAARDEGEREKEGNRDKRHGTGHDGDPMAT
ncbi:hypothetical protein GCM10010515_12770 [Streptomyces fructofermentans]|uniref:Uncharacterized protein n=1 Tax=Streptomyces fructofermentans TaxID=152141 RepID=A0A918K3K9_9ACTN|nr:hypothetical protein GCM10010515_12770 [Streptomyces fructofermentans]